MITRRFFFSAFVHHASAFEEGKGEREKRKKKGALERKKKYI
jgi:hypothetical protein